MKKRWGDEADETLLWVLLDTQCSVSLYGRVSYAVGCLLPFRWQNIWIVGKELLDVAAGDSTCALVTPTTPTYCSASFVDTWPCTLRLQAFFPSTLNPDCCLGQVDTVRLTGAATTVDHTTSRLTHLICKPTSCSSSRGSGVNVDGVQASRFPSLLFPPEGLCNSPRCSSPPH